MGAFGPAPVAKAAKTGGEFEKPPAGNHRGILVAQIDLGTQWQEPFKAGDKPRWQRQLFWVWELSDEQMSGATRNHVIGLKVNYTLGENSTMRALIDARRAPARIPDGESYEIEQELNKPVAVAVPLNKGGYPQVSGVSGLMKGTPVPTATYQITTYTLADFAAKKPIPDWVPYCFGEQCADIIARSREVAGEAGKAGRPVSPEKPADTATASGDQRWDVSDGKSIQVGLTTDAVLAALAAVSGPDLTRYKVKPSGQPKETAMPASEWEDKYGTIPF